MTITTAITVLLIRVNTVTPDPMRPLEMARRKVIDHNSISYTYRYQWPDPVGQIIDNQGTTMFVRAATSPIGYDFLDQTENNDMMLVNGDMKQVAHDEKKVTLYTEADQSRLAKGAIPIVFSPLTNLQKKFLYVKDATLSSGGVINYKHTVMDTVMEGKKILSEEHLLINRKSSTVDRYERRAYQDGRLAQRIVFQFMHYKFGRESSPIIYNLPVGYATEVFGQSVLEPLKGGSKAPDFALVGINGKSISLEQFKGKKILLDFSVSGCGYCKLALDHLSRENFKLSDDITIVYINPLDKKAMVESYVKKTSMKYPAIAEAKEVGKRYGVSGYPTFYLVDGNGVIEKAIVGYDKKFIDGLQQ